MNLNLNLLEKAIIATVVYYDVLDYPLTGFEVFKYLINPARLISVDSQFSEIEPVGKIFLKDILETLGSRNISFFLEEKNGFYFLREPASPSGGRGEILEIRIDHQKISDEKWKKAGKIIKWLQIIPYIKIVAVSGSLAMYNARKDSDIDLLIIARHKRIWTVRFLTSLFFQVISKRRHGVKTADRFCLNHFITDQSLKIDFPSLYNAQTYAHLVVILENEKRIYNRFQQANNWIWDYLAFYDYQKIGNQRKIKTNSFLRNIGRFQEFILSSFIGNILESLLGFFQKRLIKKHSITQNKGGRIVANENQLEFHPTSPETKILDKYNEKMISLEFRVFEKDSGLN